MERSEGELGLGALAEPAKGSSVRTLQQASDARTFHQYRNRRVERCSWPRPSRFLRQLISSALRIPRDERTRVKPGHRDVLDSQRLKFGQSRSSFPLELYPLGECSIAISCKAEDKVSVRSPGEELLTTGIRGGQGVGGVRSFDGRVVDVECRETCEKGSALRRCRSNKNAPSWSLIRASISSFASSSLAAAKFPAYSALSLVHQLPPSPHISQTHLCSADHPLSTSNAFTSTPCTLNSISTHSTAHSPTSLAARCNTVLPIPSLLFTSVTITTPAIPLCPPGLLERPPFVPLADRERKERALPRERERKREWRSTFMSWGREVDDLRSGRGVEGFGCEWDAREGAGLGEEEG